MLQLKFEFKLHNFSDKKENSYATEETLFPGTESPFSQGIVNKQDPYQLPS